MQICEHDASGGSARSADDRAYASITAKAALPVVANLDSMLSMAACIVASTLSAVATLGFLRAVASEASPSAADSMLAMEVTELSTLRDTGT